MNEQLESELIDISKEVNSEILKAVNNLKESQLLLREYLDEVKQKKDLSGALFVYQIAKSFELQSEFAKKMAIIVQTRLGKLMEY